MLNIKKTFLKEELFSAIMDTAGVLIVVLNKNGNLIHFNKACGKILSISNKNILNKYFVDLFMEKEDWQSPENFLENILSDQINMEKERRFVSNKGIQFLISWNNTILFDEDGEVEYIVSIGKDISEERRLEKEIIETSRLEQTRIGQDLHDDLGQLLTGIAFLTKVLEKKLQNKKLKEVSNVKEIVKLVNESISKTRGLARGLYPIELEANGLISALKELVSNQESMFNISCSLKYNRGIDIKDKSVSTHLFRIVQESINNAKRHGLATKIEVSLNFVKDSIILYIKDNGIGIKTELETTKGMGLRIMNYRSRMIGASLEILNLVDGGTNVICSIKNFRNKLMKDK